METDSDYGFGFNDVKYSTTTLRLVILPDHHKHDDDSICTKRRLVDTALQPARKKHRDCVKYCLEDNSLEKTQEIVTDGDDAKVVEKMIHVNNLILAGKSQFFRKLFSNGMKESQQQHGAIRIQASEEGAFMDMLQFMYSGVLSRMTTPSTIWDVMIVADKFDVPSCIRHCNQLLVDFPMTLELALRYVELDSSGLMPESMRPNLDEIVKNFLAEHFKDTENDKLQEELLELPVVGVEAVLSSDYLQITSEDDVYDFIVKWVNRHYSSNQLEERRKSLSLLVGRTLRFPFVSAPKLNDILTCTEIDPAISSELAYDALLYHQGRPPRAVQTPEKFAKRAYKHPCLKVVAFDESSSHPQSIVYLDFTRDQCEKSFANRSSVIFQHFFLGRHKIGLQIHCKQDEEDPGFGLFFTYTDDTILILYAELASIKRQSRKFVRIHEQKSMILNKDEHAMTGWNNLFEVPWDEFISEDSPYFVNDIVRVRIHLKLCDTDLDL